MRASCFLRVQHQHTDPAGPDESASALAFSVQTHAGNSLTHLRRLENVSGLEMEALSRIKCVVNQEENI